MIIEPKRRSKKRAYWGESRKQHYGQRKTGTDGPCRIDKVQLMLRKAAERG